MLEMLEAYQGTPLTKDELPCAYVLKERTTGKMYIGSSMTPTRRRTEHMSALKNGRHGNKDLQRVYDNGGEFDLVIYTTPTREEAYDLEEALINHYKPKGLLFNVATDAREAFRGLVQSEAEKERVRTLRLGAKSTRDHIEKIRQANTGKRHSSETKAKISAVRKGVPVTPQQRLHLKAQGAKRQKAVLIEGVRYDGIRACERAIGIEQSVIRHRIKSPNPKFSNWLYA